VFVSVTALTICGCSHSHTATPPDPTVQKSTLHLVPAPRVLLRKCRATARTVGYAVPCPTFIPARLALGISTAMSGCLDVIGPGGQPARGAAAKSWRGWVVGTSNVGVEHLAITASPGPLKDFAELVNGPGWYPGARVRPLGAVQVNGRRMHAVYVPPATNDGNMFMRHVCPRMERARTYVRLWVPQHARNPLRAPSRRAAGGTHQARPSVTIERRQSRLGRCPGMSLEREQHVRATMGVDSLRAQHPDSLRNAKRSFVLGVHDCDYPRHCELLPTRI
jgi:hypothetical protein